MTLTTTAIPFSRAKAARMPSSSSSSSSPSKPDRWFIIDTLPCRAPSNIRALDTDVRDLARKLKRADAFTFGLLNCKGVVRVFGQPQKQLDLTGFDLVFNVPEGGDATRMTSLRALLLGVGQKRDEGVVSVGEPPSLTRRVRLARELATSVSYVHTFDFVHKNIRPESVLLLDEGERKDGSTMGGCGGSAGDRLRSSFLVGFDSFRSVGGYTNMMGDQDWEYNVYRQPKGMGEFPAEEYRMQHDIYSLGVCLLEVGMWEPLVEYSGGESGTHPSGLVTTVLWVAISALCVTLARSVGCVPMVLAQR
ncbi:hypothetical protein N658DRAFT_510889 [Parathielavia hyrcaniae]|uniref:Protein kinase domain-containing protein n=1 Tax=Parathielavia hyrcaniae TaxID=113614 RepID=A0AAN6PRV0_9PEZI|nr:hypothetical protein N658DRAFT_510889 [Parathielavia hyrcaniae]